MASYNSNAELYKFGERYYDPSVGQWTQQDPMSGSLFDPSTGNRYAYANDDPTNLIDPLGTDVVSDLWNTATQGASSGVSNAAYQGALPPRAKKACIKQASIYAINEAFAGAVIGGLEGGIGAVPGTLVGAAIGIDSGCAYGIWNYYVWN